MKKLFAILLCLVLFLPPLALAETTGETVSSAVYTVAFDGFTIDLGENDYYEAAETKGSNEVYVIVYPNYDPEAGATDNFNIVWYNGDASAELAAYEPTEYAALILETAKPQYEALGVKVNKAEVLEASYEDGVYVSMTYSELDYSGMGYDMVLPNYQMQFYICLTETDTYIITLTATTLEALETMLPYLDTIQFE